METQCTPLTKVSRLMVCGQIIAVDTENINGPRAAVVTPLLIQLTAPVPTNAAMFQVSNRSFECSCPSQSPSYLNITFSRRPFSYHSVWPTDGLFARLRPTFGHRFDYPFVFYVTPPPNIYLLFHHYIIRQVLPTVSVLIFIHCLVSSLCWQY